MRFVASVTMVDPHHYVPLAKAAEEAGFDGVSVSDSVCYPRESDARYPYTPDGSREFIEHKPFLEPIVALTAMAVATERIELIPFVLKLPIRQPVLFAKSATSLAVLSRGRFRLGIGTSPWPEDYVVADVPWKARGRRLEECVEVLRLLQRGGYQSFQGEFYAFPDIKLNPVPEEPIPLLFPGTSDALLDRAARLGDGWVSTGLGLDELKDCLRRLDEARARHGRADLPFAVHATVPPESAALEEFAAAGVTHAHTGYHGPHSPLEIEPDTEPLEAKVERLHRFGEKVIAAFTP